MLIETNSKLVMIGDSITDAGRKRPIGEGVDSGWGSGYVEMVFSSFMANHPDKKIHLQNMGVSGNTIRDLKSRWQTDVIDLKPDYLSIMIGINDVWRKYGAPEKKDACVEIDEYEKTYIELIEKTLPAVKTIIFMTPYFIEPNKQDAMRSSMDAYSAVVKKLATKYKQPFVDVQAAFDIVLEKLHPMALANDRVHPNPSGHAIIANAFLKTIGAI